MAFLAIGVDCLVNVMFFLKFDANDRTKVSELINDFLEKGI